MFNLFFNRFLFLFAVVFLLIFGMAIANIVRGIGQWNKNNNAPRLTVEAAVVAKRGDVSRQHHHHNGGAMYTAAPTPTTLPSGPERRPDGALRQRL